MKVKIRKEKKSKQPFGFLRSLSGLGFFQNKTRLNLIFANTMGCVECKQLEVDRKTTWTGEQRVDTFSQELTSPGSLCTIIRMRESSHTLLTTFYTELGALLTVSVRT